MVNWLKWFCHLFVLSRLFSETYFIRYLCLFGVCYTMRNKDLIFELTKDNVGITNMNTFSIITKSKYLNFLDYGSRMQSVQSRIYKGFWWFTYLSPLEPHYFDFMKYLMKHLIICRRRTTFCEF